jgi:hypothetical protein
VVFGYSLQWDLILKLNVILLSFGIVVIILGFGLVFSSYLLKSIYSLNFYCSKRIDYGSFILLDSPRLADWICEFGLCIFSCCSYGDYNGCRYLEKTSKLRYFVKKYLTLFVLGLCSFSSAQKHHEQWKYGIWRWGLVSLE